MQLVAFWWFIKGGTEYEGVCIIKGLQIKGSIIFTYTVLARHQLARALSDVPVTHLSSNM